MIYLRVTLSIAALISALFAPVWLTSILVLVLIALFEAWEVVFLGVLIDMLYLPASFPWFIPMPATLTVIVLLWLMIPIRKRLLVGRE